MFQPDTLGAPGGFTSAPVPSADRTLFVQAVADVEVVSTGTEGTDLAAIQERFLDSLPAEFPAEQAVNPDLSADPKITRQARENLAAKRLAEGRGEPQTWEETERYIDELAAEKTRLIRVMAAKALNSTYNPENPHRHIKQGPHTLLRLIKADEPASVSEFVAPAVEHVPTPGWPKHLSPVYKLRDGRTIPVRR